MSALRDWAKETSVFHILNPYRTAFKGWIENRKERREERRRFWNFSPEDRQRIQFYSQFVSEGDLVFDVGANEGNRCKLFLELGCNVVAFEPQKVCVEFLHRVMAGRHRFNLAPVALGAAEMTTEMMVSDVNVLSSLSRDWIDATRGSGRFASIKWDHRETVKVSTLDAAIRKFGRPGFIKIDVEGYELEVLRGLSTPVKCLSMEFTAEYLDNTLLGIDHLAGLGKIEGQISHGESMKFDLPNWVHPAALKTSLTEVPTGSAGDVYIRFVDRV
jgi:FkbM family methyltransferase